MSQCTWVPKIVGKYAYCVLENKYAIANVQQGNNCLCTFVYKVVWLLATIP